MLTPKISGIFDCRAYDQSGKLEHAQRRMLADTDNVTFSAIFPLGEVPECFMQGKEFDPFCRKKVSKREREAAQAEGREAVEDVLVAKFKIGQSTKWFDKHGQACTRPTNEQLEDGRYNVQIDFTRREKDDSKPLSPSGYWVNAIMISKQENNPFVGQAFEPLDEPESEADAEEQQKPEASGGDLLF